MIERTPKPPQASAEGDAVVIGRTRWVIRAITRNEVELESMNHPNASIWWTTDLKNLPEKTA